MARNKETDTPGKNKIYIVDDHPIVRQGLSLLINQEADLMVCGEASDSATALQDVPVCQPDVVLVDISLGQSSGLRLIEDLLLKIPDLRILVLSMHDESLYAERCFRFGAKGYIMKQDSPEKVILAIKSVLRGEIYLSEKMSTKLLHKFVTRNSDGLTSPIEKLSNRELEVFEYIGRGLKTRKIAEELNLSIKTIETYIDHIKRKMNFDDSRDLFLNAVQWCMSEQSQPDKKTRASKSKK